MSFQQINAQMDETSRAWNQPVKPFRIIGNVYYVGAANVSSFLITTPEGHFLIDSGFAETVPQIRQNIAELGFRIEDVKILLNSHAHYDHAGGLAALKALTKAKFMASEADAVLLANGGKGDFSFGDRLAYEPVTTDQILHDGDVIRLGDVSLTAHLTPGHTKGCTTWTMQVSDEGRNYNVVFVGSTSVLDSYKLIDNEKYPGIADDYRKTFQLSKKLKADVFLASHGNFFNLPEKMARLAQKPKQNPFIDPKGYRDFIRETEKTFKKQLKAQEKSRK